MLAALDDFAGAEHEHLVGIANGAQAVGNDETGAAGQQFVQSNLNLALGARVHAGRRFIQDQDVRIAQRRAGDGQKLALPLAETAAALAQQSLIAIGQALDELVGLHQPGRGDHFVIAGFGFAVANVVHDRVTEEEGVLQDDADLPTQAGRSDIAHINAINAHRAIGDVVEARQQVDDGGLARAGGADDGNGLAWFSLQADILQDRNALLVRGMDMIELHAPLDDWERLRAGLVFHLRHLVEEIEDALTAGNGALDVGPQHRHLLNGLIETLDVVQESHDQAQGDGGSHQVVASHQGQAADACHDGNRHIAKRFQGGRERAGISHRADVCVTIGRVGHAELVNVLLFAVERLHLAHVGNRLLQVGVDIADLLAAAAEGLARLAGEPKRGHDHERQDGQRDQGIGPVQAQHLVHHPGDQQETAGDIDQGKGKYLLDGVNVVGDAAHDRPRLMFGIVVER